ncbi:MAG: nitrite reductase [Lamprobacter sp.]|uniref:nitrite reductase n=1 Tax=Lamprobacter sp. TaxID=3100796 RepID=UPI002B25E4AA|nr:nitrite reductase [Lamprobacter sp.]MEA3641529.1 nitrite reductase [Lamprobacter sp.]
MNFRSLFATKTRRRVAILLAIILVPTVLYKLVYPLFFDAYTGVKNAPLTYDSRKLSDAEFEQLALELTKQTRIERALASVRQDQDPFAREVKAEILMNTPSFFEEHGYKHIKYFREAGIREYKGPETCLECHATIDITHEDGTIETVDTLENIVNTVHFKFQSAAGGAFSTYGYDGRQVNAEGARKIPVGKINRACGIPGSFSWTGWAALVESKPEHALESEAQSSPVEDQSHAKAVAMRAATDGSEAEHRSSDAVVMRSEGCGQCHIGGNYHPATEKMMPVGDVPDVAKQGIDCLICHAAEYDMDQRYVIQDKKGLRWNQDRSMRAALTVGRATNQNCLNCHQHNMGGDAYIHNVAAQHLGEKHQRLLHTGAKRGNPFSPEDDVHAAAGIKCTDCHEPQGHKIPRGRKGVDLVATDLPDKDVTCESCHSKTPHNLSDHRALLNGHVARLACETCHIKQLQDNNVVLRDWVHPTWDAEEGIWTPTDIYRSGEPGKGMMYLWFNGNGTFLANALGSNPEGDGSYDPLMQQIARIDNPEVIAAVRTQAQALKKQYPDIDVERYVERATDPLSQLSPEMLEKRRQMVSENLRAAMEEGESRIYPFKPFNAMMYEDMNNQGPFGAMILPFDYATYYETGDTRASVAKAIQDPIVKRMYQEPFKLYMMDEFMAYFGVEGGWKTLYPLTEDGQLGPQVEPHWMRQMGTLMVNHGIQREGHGCKDCHQPGGILDYAALGYPPERAAELSSMDLIEGIEP